MNLKVKKITYCDLRPWLLKRHYAKRMPSVTHKYGLYDGVNIVGVLTFGVPASPHLCRGICGDDHAGFVIELNRLCIEEGVKRNAASFFISSAIKLLPKPSIIVSFADTSMSHVGYVYQASNFIYTGLTPKKKDRFPVGYSGNNHSRHASKNTKKENLEWIHRPRKHRYIFIHASKTQKKRIVKKLRYKKEPYPKAESKRYNADCHITKQIELFT